MLIYNPPHGKSIRVPKTFVLFELFVFKKSSPPKSHTPMLNPGGPPLSCSISVTFPSLMKNEQSYFRTLLTRYIFQSPPKRTINYGIRHGRKSKAENGKKSLDFQVKVVVQLMCIKCVTVRQALTWHRYHKYFCMFMQGYCLFLCPKSGYPENRDFAAHKYLHRRQK